MTRYNLAQPLNSRLLTTIRRQELQELLQSKAEDLGEEVLKHLRFDLNKIFKTAMGDGLIAINPAHLLCAPRGRGSKPRRDLTAKEALKLLDSLELRERLIVRLAIYEGMRPGEILGLRWQDVCGNYLRIVRRSYKGDIDVPKTRDPRDAGLSDGTVQDLNDWRSKSRDLSPEAYVFPSEKLTTPLWLDNVWRRNLLPVFTKIGLGWATFQVMRRANANFGEDAKVDRKVASDQRGHDVRVSLNKYASSSIDKRISTVREVEAHLLRIKREELDN